MKDKLQSLEEMAIHCEALGRIADAYSPGSPEEGAIKIAATALQFATLEHHKAFHDFVSDFDKPLTKTHLDHLRRMGLK